MPLPYPIGRQRRDRGQIKRWLSDEVRRVSREPFGVSGDFLVRRLGSDQHTIAARTMDFLHHKIVKIISDVFQLIRV